MFWARGGKLNGFESFFLLWLCIIMTRLFRHMNDMCVRSFLFFSYHLAAHHQSEIYVYWNHYSCACMRAFVYFTICLMMWVSMEMKNYCVIIIIIIKVKWCSYTGKLLFVCMYTIYIFGKWISISCCSLSSQWTHIKCLVKSHDKKLFRECSIRIWKLIALLGIVTYQNGRIDVIQYTCHIHIVDSTTPRILMTQF